MKKQLGAAGNVLTVLGDLFTLNSDWSSFNVRYAWLKFVPSPIFQNWLYSNDANPDEVPYSAATVLGLHCLCTLVYGLIKSLVLLLGSRFKISQRQICLKTAGSCTLHIG